MLLPFRIESHSPKILQTQNINARVARSPQEASLRRLHTPATTFVGVARRSARSPQDCGNMSKRGELHDEARRFSNARKRRSHNANKIFMDTVEDCLLVRSSTNYFNDKSSPCGLLLASKWATGTSSSVGGIVRRGRAIGLNKWSWREATGELVRWQLGCVWVRRDMIAVTGFGVYTCASPMHLCEQPLRTL